MRDEISCRSFTQRVGVKLELPSWIWQSDQWIKIWTRAPQRMARRGCSTPDSDAGFGSRGHSEMIRLKKYIDRKRLGHKEVDELI